MSVIPYESLTRKNPLPQNRGVPKKKVMRKLIALLLTTLTVISALFVPLSFGAVVAVEAPTPPVSEAGGTQQHRYTVKDVTKIQRYLAQLDSVNAEELKYLDVNKDNKLAILDATLIQKHCAEYFDIYSEEFRQQYCKEPTTEEYTTEPAPEETTVEPVNEESTTAEPTTVVPTTEESSTVEPETEPTVTDQVDARDFTLNESSFVMGTGESVQLTATFTDGSTANQKTFTSSNTAAATVNENGLVTGVAPGKTTITCTLANGAEQTCEVVVKIATTYLALTTGDKVTVTLDEEVQLATKVDDDSAAYRTTYTSDDPDIVSVTEDGLLKGVHVGKTYITCKLSTGKECRVKACVSYATTSLRVTSSVPINEGENYPSFVIGNTYEISVETFQGDDDGRYFKWEVNKKENCEIISVNHNKAIIAPKRWGGGTIKVTDYNGVVGEFTYNSTTTDVKLIDMAQTTDDKINYFQLKEDGYKYVIFKLGHGTEKDNSFFMHSEAAMWEDIRVGAYWECEAKTEEEAAAEAEACVAALKDVYTDLPVFYKLNDEWYKEFIFPDYQKNQRAWKVKERKAAQAVLFAFLDTVKEAGFNAGVQATCSLYFEDWKDGDMFRPATFHNRGYYVWSVDSKNADSMIGPDIRKYKGDVRLTGWGLPKSATLNDFYNFNMITYGIFEGNNPLKYCIDQRYKNHK